MNPEVKEKWTTALISGEYTQGTGTLRTPEDRYCCLGVLADVMNHDGWYHPEVTLYGENGDEEVEVEDDVWRHWVGDDSLDNREFIDACGLDETVLVDDAGYQVEVEPIERLIEMNDGGKTFEEITEWINENL